VTRATLDNAHATLTDSAGERPVDSQHAPGLTLVYRDGLTCTGEQLSLAGRAALLIGRDERLFPGGPLADPRMSGRHAVLVLDQQRWTLVDRDSKNGTFIAGQRVTEHALSPGDVIRIGSTFMVFGRIAPRGDRKARLNGLGAAMAEVEEGIALVAGSDHTVLLLGESGTGKELVAHELHRVSGRPGPLLAINCASLRGELLESELFGHVKGAFTGAQKAHDGLFARARAGTVFLDEVGEMDEAIQARLLRVLEAKAIRSVGASEEIPVTTRVIAATNREVDTLFSGQHMRPDLYARLARWTIALPPLRERKEDLGVLTQVLLARDPGLANDVSADFMAALLAATWPLNIRGLVNVLTSARIAQPQASRLELVERVRTTLAAGPATPLVRSAPANRDPGRAQARPGAR